MAEKEKGSELVVNSNGLSSDLATILRPSDLLPLLFNLTTRINGCARASRSNCFELLNTNCYGFLLGFFSNAFIRLFTR